MSVPQIPIRWTRTRASPGPGLAGESISMRLEALGRFEEQGFHRRPFESAQTPGLGGRVVVLGPAFGVVPVVDRLEDLPGPRPAAPGRSAGRPTRPTSGRSRGWPSRRRRSSCPRWPASIAGRAGRCPPPSTAQWSAAFFAVSRTNGRRLVPGRQRGVGQEPGRERRGVHDADALALQVGDQVGQHRVLERVMVVRQDRRRGRSGRGRSGTSSSGSR